MVPEEYRNAFCKAAEEEDLEVVRLAKKKKRAEKSTGKKLTSSIFLNVQAPKESANEKPSSSTTVRNNDSGSKKARNPTRCSVYKQIGHNKKTCVINRT